MTNNAKNTKRPPLSAFFIVLAVLSVPSVGDEIDLTPRKHAGSFVRVKTIVDVAGSLELATLNKTQREQPVEVQAELFFDEQGLDGEFQPAVRHYWDAKADLRFGDKEQTRTLREERRLVALQDVDSLNNRFWSPYGMLQRQELDLIDVVSNAFPPENLLPTTSVDEEATWPVEQQTVARLLRLNEVTSGELTNAIEEVTEDTVKISVKGTIEGTSEGAKTNIEVQGKYHFDRKARIITWLAFGIQEQREIGFAAPGFQVTARVRSARQAIDQSEALPESLVRKIRRKPELGELLVEFESEGDVRYRAALDRRWRLVNQQDESARLRLVEDGDLLTTCKVDRLNRMPAGQQITLDGFQGDVRSALAKNCKQIISAGETINAQGVRVLRVVAGGEVAKTPIHWVYYHLSDNDGQRLSLIFSHEAAMETRLQGIDESFTSSLSLLPRDAVQASDEVQAASEEDPSPVQRQAKRRDLILRK